MTIVHCRFYNSAVLHCSTTATCNKLVDLHVRIDPSDPRPSRVTHVLPFSRTCLLLSLKYPCSACMRLECVYVARRSAQSLLSSTHQSVKEGSYRSASGYVTMVLRESGLAGNLKRHWHGMRCSLLLAPRSSMSWLAERQVKTIAPKKKYCCCPFSG